MNIIFVKFKLNWDNKGNELLSCRERERDSETERVRRISAHVWVQNVKSEKLSFVFIDTMKWGMCDSYLPREINIRFDTRSEDLSFWNIAFSNTKACSSRTLSWGWVNDCSVPMVPPNRNHRRKSTSKFRSRIIVRFRSPFISNYVHLSSTNYVCH